MRRTRPPAPLPPAMEASLREAARRLEGAISAEQHADIVNLLDHNEPGVALETLCSHLYEEDVEIDDDARHLIAGAGNLMGLNPLLWERLVLPPGRRSTLTAGGF